LADTEPYNADTEDEEDLRTVKQENTDEDYSITTKTKDFVCNCGKSYVTKGSLTRHQEGGCLSGAKEQCRFCGRYYRKEFLPEHVKYGHSKKFLCVCKCGSKYRWPQQLNRHKKKCKK